MHVAIPTLDCYPLMANAVYFGTVKSLKNPLATYFLGGMALYHTHAMINLHILLHY